MTPKTTHKPTSPKAQRLQDALHAYQDAQSTILDNLGAVMSYCQSNRPSIEHTLDPQDRALLDAYALLEPLLDSDKRPFAYCEQVSNMLDLIAQTLVNRLDRHKQGFILGALDHIEHTPSVASGKQSALDHQDHQDHIEHMLDPLDPLGLAQDPIEQAAIERVMCFANIKQAQGLITKASGKQASTPKQARDALVYAYNLLEHTSRQPSTPKQARLSIEHALDALLFGGALELDAPSIEQDTIEQAQANITYALDVYRALFGNIERTLASIKGGSQDHHAPRPSNTPLTAWGGAFVDAQDGQTAQDDQGGVTAWVTGKKNIDLTGFDYIERVYVTDNPQDIIEHALDGQDAQNLDPQDPPF